MLSESTGGAEPAPIPTEFSGPDFPVLPIPRNLKWGPHLRTTLEPAPIPTEFWAGFVATYMRPSDHRLSGTSVIQSDGRSLK